MPADAAPDEALVLIEGGVGEGGGGGEDADPLAPPLAAAPDAPADPAPPLADPPLLPDDGGDGPLLPDEPDELADPELGSRSVGVVLIVIPPALPPDEAAAAAADALPPAADNLRHYLLTQCRCECLQDHTSRQSTVFLRDICRQRQCSNSTSSMAVCRKPAQCVEYNSNIHSNVDAPCTSHL